LTDALLVPKLLLQLNVKTVGVLIAPVVADARQGLEPSHAGKPEGSEGLMLQLIPVSMPKTTQDRSVVAPARTRPGFAVSVINDGGYTRCGATVRLPVPDGHDSW
jgi:hypothetical protein